MSTEASGGTSPEPAGGAPDAFDVAELILAGDFETPTREAWEELVAAVLRKSGSLPEGADPRTASHQLASRTLDGFTIEPLYLRGDGSLPGYPGVAPFVRGRTAGGHVRHGWDIRQRHENPDAAATRAAVLSDLENGVTSLWLVVGEGGIAVSDLPTVLADVHLDLAPIVLDAGAHYDVAASMLLSTADERGVTRNALRGNLGADPISVQARSGVATDIGPAVRWARSCAEKLPGIRAITVDATPYHEAGASDAQELGASIAAGVAYLRAAESAGMTVEAAAGQLEFRYVAGADQFLTIAKLRAARRLWTRVTSVCGVTGEAQGQLQHAVTSWAMTTKRDPWVNMLRDTLACFGAGIGGADSVTVLPFDAAIGIPDEFSRRLARNTQSVLIQESNLARVIDPAGGSWYVESLTDEVAQAAWAYFQQIESHGGIVDALSSGFVAESIGQTRTARDARLATREDVIVGVSEFPFLAETPVVRPAPSAVATGGLPRIRYAETYEALRDRADAYAAAHGAPPAVFLAGLGSQRDRSARTVFATGAVTPGGFEPIESTSEDLAALGTEFASSQAPIAIICSSDAVYAEQAADAAAILSKNGAQRILLAGRPGKNESAYRAAGIDGFVFIGSDILALLTDLHDALEVR